MIEQRTKTIAGKQFRVTQLPSLQALRVITRVYQTFGPVIAKLIAGVDTKALLEEGKPLAVQDLKLSVVTDMMTELAERISVADLEWLVETFQPHTEVIGSSGDFMSLNKDVAEHFFAGRMMMLFQWLFFCMEVNYTDFFSGLGALKKGASAQKPPSTSESPSTSTGSSTASQ